MIVRVGTDKGWTTNDHVLYHRTGSIITVCVWASHTDGCGDCPGAPGARATGLYSSTRVITDWVAEVNFQWAMDHMDEVANALIETVKHRAMR